MSARFALLRRENAALLETIPGAAWRLKGRHDEYGELCLRELIEDYIAHTAKHLDQMRSVSASFDASNSQTARLIARLRGTEMTTEKDKTPHHKETKDREPKGKSKLVGRVKKVIKKSRRKLGEEKFEKELQRTIEFLAQLRLKLDNSLNGKEDSKKSGEPAKKTEKKSVRRVEKKAERKTARSEAKKAKPKGKSVKKAAAKGASKKGKGAAPKSNGAAQAPEPAVAPQPETLSASQQPDNQ